MEPRIARKYPLLRRNGKLERVSWEEALATMVERFRKAQSSHGPGALGVLSTGQLVTEEFYTLGKLVQLGFGTNNYDGNTTLCMASAVSGYKLSFGSDGPPGNYEDMELADVVLLIGANIADNHPILCQYLEANRNKTLIVADPRVTKTAMMADLHLPLKPRSDLALINGIAHILIRFNLIDREYIEKHTIGIRRVGEVSGGLSSGTSRRHNGPEPGSDFQDSVPLWKRQSRLYRLDDGRESQHHRHGDGQRDLQSGAAYRTDRPSRRGAVFDHGPVQRDGHARGRLYFEHAGLSQVRRSGGPRGARGSAGRCEERLPAKRGLAYPDIVEAAVAKKIRALWIIATNPLVSYPNQGVLRHALSNLDFLVVQDGYHPTPTTELADLVLPAAIWGEKEGTYTNSERRVSKVNKSRRPAG